jgi:phosphoglycerate dehydrogenase-like enzyme
VAKHPIWSSDVIMTNGSGIQAPIIAEWAIAMVHHFAKEMPRLSADQQSRTWGKFGWHYRPIAGATLGIVGLGHIGGEIAARARSLGMRVLATRRTASGRRLRADGVDELFPPEHLNDLLAQSDYVVVSVPHTRLTDRLMGQRQFAAMRPGTYLINVCRGGVVDEAALIGALASGHLGGAALDVFETEPLPEESPLWDMPNVVVSPHRSGAIDTTMDLALDLLTENLRRYLGQRPLLNVVRREQGY